MIISSLCQFSSCSTVSLHRRSTVPDGSEDVRDDGSDFWPRENSQPFEGAISLKYRTICNTEEILRNNRKSISSRLISRDITFDFDNLLLKQKFSNDKDNNSWAVGFWISKLSFPIKFMRASLISLLSNTFAIFAVHKRLSEIFIREKRFRAVDDLVSSSQQNSHRTIKGFFWPLDLSMIFQIAPFVLRAVASSAIHPCGFSSLRGWMAGDWSIPVMHLLGEVSSSCDDSFRLRDEWSCPFRNMFRGMKLLFGNRARN
jgi:hypothetical protein